MRDPGAFSIGQLSGELQRPKFREYVTSTSLVRIGSRRVGPTQIALEKDHSFARCAGPPGVQPYIVTEAARKGRRAMMVDQREMRVYVCRRSLRCWLTRRLLE